MLTYPVMLNIKHKHALVVGGGRIGYRRIIGLLKAGAHVTVVSPVLHPKVEKLVADNHIVWQEKTFTPRDLALAWIVVAATNDPVVNEFIASSAHDTQLVNIVDQPEGSQFHVPATVTRGGLAISVSTGGASPTLANMICEELRTKYDSSYESYIKFLALSRQKIKQLDLAEQKKAQLLREVTREEYRISSDKQMEFLKRLTSS